MSVYGPGRGRPAGAQEAAPPRRLAPRRSSLALRGVIAAAVLVVVSGMVLAYGNGVFDDDPTVTATVPADAGLLTGHVSVQYQGVEVGEVTDIDAGTDSSTVRLEIDSGALGRIPADVMVRVAPRTLFGDVVIELVPDPSAPRTGRSLQPGDALRTDTSPQAVRLYNIYERAVGVMDRLEPQRMQTALTAAAGALRGKGDDLGRALDSLSRAADTLTPAARQWMEHAPQIATVAEAADAATGQGLGIVRDMTALSHAVTDRPGSLAAFFEQAGAVSSTISGIADDNSGRLQRIVDQAAPALAAAAEGRQGLPDTFRALRGFTVKATPAFASGRFDITAVPSFSDPLPYTAADCPRYGGLAGANCTGGGG